MYVDNCTRLKIRHRSVFLFIALANLMIVLNVYPLRQILGFILLATLPGVLIIQVLKLDKIESIEKFVLSIGISISFLILFGLLINDLLFAAGYSEPLSTISFLIPFNIVLVVLLTIICKSNKSMTFYISISNLSNIEKVFLITPISFLTLSIAGTSLMKIENNNSVLLILFFLIAIYVILVCIFYQRLSKRLYPIVIFLIGMSILILLPLRSDHIIGIDSHKEYYLFQMTLNNLHWKITESSTLGGMISISLLPTIFQSILNSQPEFIFKILYPLIYSICPLVVYILSKKYVGEFYAFLSSCFFMFQWIFLWTEYNARTSIAILFFGLSMMVLFNDNMINVKKNFLIIMFMASSILSHYSTTYIFFIIMLGTFIGMEIIYNKFAIKGVIQSSIITIFFIMIFFWYSQVTKASFYYGVKFIRSTFVNLSQFFVEESRTQIPAMIGKGILEKGIPHKIEFIFTWLTFLLIGIGIITLFRKYKEISFPELSFKRSEFLKNKLDIEYSLIAIECVLLLIVMVTLPFVSTGYSIDRLYAIVGIILAVFYIVGAMTISKNLKVKPWLVILIVLIPYFLSITGVTYNLLGYPRSIILNSQGDEYDKLYVNDQESYGAKWLSYYWQKSIYTDHFGNLRLISQGLVPSGSIDSMSLADNKKINGYIYLRTDNIVNSRIIDKNFIYHTITNYSFLSKNKIYENGGSDIYLTNDR